MTLEKHITTDQLLFDFRVSVERITASGSMIMTYNRDIQKILEELKSIRTYSFTWQDVIPSEIPEKVLELYNLVTSPVWCIAGNVIDNKDEQFRQKVIKMTEEADFIAKCNNKLSIGIQNFYATLHEMLWNDFIRINPDKSLTDLSRTPQTV